MAVVRTPALTPTVPPRRVYAAVWAAGAAVAGVSFARACRLAGRRSVLWWSALAAVGGAALFTTARTLALTMTGALVLGFGGTMLQAATQSVLSDRHGIRRDKALVEANIGAGLCAVAAPLTLGVLQATPVTWRAGMALPAWRCRLRPSPCCTSFTAASR
jgi:MFS family permease